ncbi:helix-turn-helix domain-containing protein [Halosegnis rubeus]|jgi:predicted fused transcriptional regulator/phosphomethylpyrimidine kinase/predicted transcriptional regulator|uniref:Helix-turn-helix domain-containing protein n=1 Tax=Halosegnis rubeus TaxID=2212850 RepID=A0A5N5UH68_9EURY|nr:thiamine-phosphate synthase family protein [Halosegnis rubeus]KAB7515795.1 helix-turn-helix domain-containing protein [Halosegnis rubeus]KAB7516991.1 helix-turn-helix domain-containing protein [Halosegnis rubeus]KAB7519881.1 helix-turn-helix domain-containing protein [Halosegnis rubeus]
MRFIEEVVVDEFLPTFRALLAGDLRDRGLTQSEVADLLGISQSAVSKYAHGDVDTNDRLAGDERVQDLVVRLGAGLASGDVTPVQALVETEVLIRQLERGDVLARLHEETFPPLTEYEGDFAVHDADSEVRTAERVLASVRRGVRTLENTSGFAGLIPAVGSNLVETLPDATGIEDVAGVPGRILDVKGRATVPGDPEFGVSEHVATVLLAARAGGSGARAALNIRYDDEIATRFAEAGLATAEFDAEASVETAVAETVTDDVDVVFQSGGFGIEPAAYLLGADAGVVAELVRELL